MSQIKVCKLVRLGKDGDHFKQDLVANVMRTNAKIPADYVEEFNAQWKTRGQIYIVDEEATKARNEAIVNQKDEPKGIDQLGREELKSIAKGLGIDYPKKISTLKLKELIDSHE